MGRRKGTPESSGEEPDDKETKDDKKKEAAPAEEATKQESKPNPDEIATQPIGIKPDPKDLPPIVPPPPKAEPWPDATPEPMKPVEAADAVVKTPARERPTETIAMPPMDLGKPPEMPRSTAPPPLALGDVENPTHMPGPKEVPAGNPDDPAPAPGVVPPGDSRSLRRGNEFALIYRVGTCVVTRIGTVGTRGQWRVVEYPTYAFASNSYAKECSRFVSEGFSDYRV
jgi:hypothetical protein